MSERESLVDARAALRGWAAEDAEGRVMTVVEDPSVLEYVTQVLDALDRAERLNGILRAAFRRRMREWAEHGRDYGYGEEDVEEFLLTAEREADLPTIDDITGIMRDD